MGKKTLELFGESKIALANFGIEIKEIREISNLEGRPFKEN
jgi:hypothetical protein